jgi:hypothetical protein
MTQYHCDQCGTDYGEGDVSFVGYATHKRERCLEVQLARTEVQRDEALAQLNTPELYDFAKAVRLEGAHQRERWGTEHDDGKSPADWFWLIGYLAGKALASHIKGDVDKALHHTITAAAALANWHSAILGKTNMRPGIARPAGEDLLAEATERADG